MEDLYNNGSASSPAIRFLGTLKQPESDSNPLELDETDVVWSTTASELSDGNSADPFSPLTQSTASSSPSNHHRHSFRPDKFGLSAAFSDDRRSLHRRPSLNPSISATSAARTIPPVPVHRFDAGPEGFARSAPVDVPAWPKGGSGSRFEVFEDVEEEEEEEEEMLPPHVIVARSHVSTFSVFEGVGRTLKGRDLRRVRNAI